MPRDEFMQLIVSTIAGKRVSLQWDWADEPSLGTGMARVLALTCLCARASLGLTGIIRCGALSRQEIPVTISAVGPEAALPAEASAWMSGGGGATLPEPKYVEFALIRGASGDAGVAIETVSEPGAVHFRIDRG
jgi:hypothetical protein